MVQLSLELHQLAVSTQGAGIEFVDEATAQPIDEAICQICGEDITREMVFCRRCKTPHHRDCWEYYGACSTYGCQEKRFTVPKMARRVSGSSRRPKKKSKE